MNVCQLRRTGFVISHVTKNYITWCTLQLLANETSISAYTFRYQKQRCNASIITIKCLEVWFQCHAKVMWSLRRRKALTNAGTKNKLLTTAETGLPALVVANLETSNWAKMCQWEVGKENTQLLLPMKISHKLENKLQKTVWRELKSTPQIWIWVKVP